ncbi:helix-turn-helix domain-containing protein [Streptomyces melanosporofaciens]|uniref:Helix-turn-helix domain-containing protein n=1 Tax=Streptomyces melanosporofaciens TaxID=67327 RepID=A0A1H4RW30_STRMJ|nr:helix-turn-helix transcriptional regulator [Streptomyces melanosporofaciens]SEC35944.1 Helix-turn-helix domain-containing protein [Streptomyces melanosporofaciens]
MALRTNPTERQRRLGAELRRLREQAGLTLNEAGALIDMGRVHLTHVEGGRTAIPSERLRRLCEGYGCTSVPLVEALVSLGEDKGKGWWSGYKGRLVPSALDLAEFESHANELHSYESLFIPGLFQTEDYTASIFRADDEANTPDHVDTAVGFRMQRQRILHGERPPEVHAVIHEAALHMRFGGAKVMRKQLLRLIELADLPHVSIQILPFTAEGISTLSTPFFMLASHGRALETVLLESPSQSSFLHDEPSLTKYRRQFHRLSTAALRPVDTTVAPFAHDSRDSLGLIQYVLYTL